MSPCTPTPKRLRDRLAALLLAGAGAFSGAGAIAPALAADDDEVPDLAAGADAPDLALDPAPARWNGWLQLDAAYAWPSPGHYTHLRSLGELSGSGAWGSRFKWKLSARASLDGAYAWSDHYPAAVRDDQRAWARLHEAYVDFSRADWEFRVGKQNIVWGEVVGLFFADVVSAKDLRDFVLPEFDRIRVAQWAARAEWFQGDSHMELVWLPAPEVDDIGEPGAEFFPMPLRYDGFGFRVDDQRRPSRKLSNSGIGMRLSTLAAGWDWTGFVYRAPDTQAAFRRTIVPGPTSVVAYEPRHELVTRIGGTVSKDFEGIVAKAEVVYTRGREFSLLPLAPGDGLVALRTIDWIVGADMTPADRWRVNLQFFQRAFIDHERDTGLDRYENGASVLLARELNPTLAAEFLAISSLNRSDRLVRAMLTWKYDANIRLRAGVDVFAGNRLGLFGRFDDSDRVWADVVYSF